MPPRSRLWMSSSGGPTRRWRRGPLKRQFGVLLEELDGLPSSAFVAKAFTGVKLVKGFNHLVAAALAGAFQIVLRSVIAPCFKLPNWELRMRNELSDDEWAAIRPTRPDKPHGVPRSNDRRVLGSIFWVLQSGAPWRDLPESLGPNDCAAKCIRICGIDHAAMWRGGIANPLSGLPRGAESHGKKPETYTVSYTYALTRLKYPYIPNAYCRLYLTQKTGLGWGDDP